jgi:hypothetical protein
MNRDGDWLLEDLSRLPMIPTELEWEARVLERCHAALGKHAAGRARARRHFLPARLLDLVAAAVLGLYFVAVLTAAVRLVGSL